MAKSQRSAATSRKAHHIGKKEYSGSEEPGARNILRMSLDVGYEELRLQLRPGIHINWTQKPVELMPKLFNELRERYLNRPGGYTRVLRIEPLKEDQAPSAILELVDGPRDIRFAMTAKTLVKERAMEEGVRDMTAKNVIKVTRFRERGKEELERTVRALENQERDEERRQRGALKRKVYPVYDEEKGRHKRYN